MARIHYSSISHFTAKSQKWGRHIPRTDPYSDFMTTRDAREHHSHAGHTDMNSYHIHHPGNRGPEVARNGQNPLFRHFVISRLSPGNEYARPTVRTHIMTLYARKSENSGCTIHVKYPLRYAEVWACTDQKRPHKARNKKNTQKHDHHLALRPWEENLVPEPGKYFVFYFSSWLPGKIINTNFSIDSIRPIFSDKRSIFGKKSRISEKRT